MTKAQRDLRALVHPAADKRDATIELHRQVHKDLHPVDARRKRRDDNLPFGAGEDLLERILDVHLRTGIAAAVDVRAVAEQREHALGAALADAMQVERLAGKRRLIDFEIAGVNQNALRRPDGQRHTVRHAVRDADELDLEWANRDDVPRLDGYQAVGGLDAVLFEFRLDEGEGERRAVD